MQDEQYLDFEDPEAQTPDSGSAQHAACSRIACWDSKAERQFQLSGAEYLGSCAALAAEAMSSEASALAERCCELLQRLKREHAQPGSQFEQQLEQVLEKGPLRLYGNSSQFCFIHGYGKHSTSSCRELQNCTEPPFQRSVVHPGVVLRLQRAKQQQQPAQQRQQQKQQQQQQKAATANGRQKRSAPATSEERSSKKAAVVAGDVQSATPQQCGYPQSTLQMFAQPSLDSNAAVISMLQSSFQDLQQEVKQLREFNMNMCAQLAAANERLQHQEASRLHYKNRVRELQEEVDRLRGFEQRCFELERKIPSSPTRSCS